MGPEDSGDPFDKPVRQAVSTLLKALSGVEGLRVVSKVELRRVPSPVEGDARADTRDACALRTDQTVILLRDPRSEWSVARAGPRSGRNPIGYSVAAAIDALSLGARGFG